MESDKSLKHKLGQFKDPVCHMCFTGAVAAPWSVMQEMAGCSPFTVMNNIFCSELSETIKEKLNYNGLSHQHY